MPGDSEATVVTAPPTVGPAPLVAAAGAFSDTSFPRSEEPAYRPIAAATGHSAIVAPAPSRGREVLSTAFVALTLFSLTWALISFFYGNMDLAIQAVGGVVVGLVLFATIYVAGRRT